MSGSWRETSHKFPVYQDRIFVFGSNLAGRHGLGAALFARRYYGAEYGVGVGPTGRAFAIPTKDQNLKTLPLDVIRLHARAFIDYANAHPELTFELTPIGCGLAGYKHYQIAPFFKGVPKNVNIPIEWRSYVGDGGNNTIQSSG